MFKNMKLKTKIIGTIVCISIVMIFLCGYSYYSLHELSQMQNEGAKRTIDAIGLQEAAGMGNKIYSVFADAIINKKYDDNRKEFEAVKSEMVNDLKFINDAVDTDIEKELANIEVEKWYNSLTTEELYQYAKNICENKNDNNNR